MIKYGKVVKIINLLDPQKIYLRKVQNSSKLFEDHKNNIIMTQDVINREYGFELNNYYICKPSIDDFVLYYWKRKTQIVYPKDAAYIVNKMGIVNGSKVLEVATGSGVMSLFLAKSIYPNGSLFTIDRNHSFIENSIKNLKDFDNTFNTNYMGLINFFVSEDVRFLRDINFDAVFLDLPNSEDFVDRIYFFLKPFGFLASVFPTTNQVSSFVKVIRGRFIDIEVEEIIVRKYKANPERLRPFDVMVAHTAYIVSAKKRN